MHGAQFEIDKLMEMLQEECGWAYQMYKCKINPEGTILLLQSAQYGKKKNSLTKS